MTRRRWPAVALLAVAALVAIVWLAADVSGAGHRSARSSAGVTAAATSAGQLAEAPTPSANPSFPNPDTATGERAYLTAVFDDAQSMWARLFAAARSSYPPTSLRIFAGAVQTACGPGAADVGPFYCPADHTVYLETSFFDLMERNFGVKGEFGQAFVVAHEVGHHVQTALGTLQAVSQAQHLNPAAANNLSVRLELQADCYAGIWAHSRYARGLLTASDLRSALAAAAAVGDDFLQQASTGQVQPEHWTHGSSAQRQQWLTVGFDRGDPAACNTFAGTGIAG